MELLKANGKTRKGHGLETELRGCRGRGRTAFRTLVFYRDFGEIDLHCVWLAAVRGFFLSQDDCGVESFDLKQKEFKIIGLPFFFFSLRLPKRGTACD